MAVEGLTAANYTFFRIHIYYIYGLFSEIVLYTSEIREEGSPNNILCLTEYNLNVTNILDTKIFICFVMSN